MKNFKKTVLVLILVALTVCAFAQDKYANQKITKEDIQCFIAAYEDPTSAKAMKYVLFSPEKQQVLAAGALYIWTPEVTKKTYGQAALDTYKLMGIDMVAEAQKIYADMIDAKDLKVFQDNKDILLASKVLKEMYVK